MRNFRSPLRGFRNRGMTRRGGGGSAPATPILDTVTGAGAAYSLRKLRTAYSGSAVRVRRSSDNTEQDIGFSGNDLDTAALSTFVGANSGFVVTWYDQSGNARNFTQSTAANQPRIVNAGVLETEGGLPTVYWDGTDILINASPFMYAAGSSTMMCVLNRPPAVTSATHLLEYNTGGLARYRVARSAPSANAVDMWNEIVNDAGTSVLSLNVIVSGLTDGTLRHFATVDTGSSFRGHINGTLSQTRSYTRSGTLTLNQTLLTGPVGTKLSEIILFPSALSNANFNTVLANQGEEYGISVTPFLTSVEQLAVINGTGDGGGSFATNLGGVSDSSEHVFIDRAKQARGWLRPSFSATPTANLDSDGALASLPSGDTTQLFFFSAHRDGGGEYVGTEPDRSGTYRLTFTGSATVTGSGITGLTMIDANTYEFDCDFVGNKWLVFTPTSFPIKATIVKTSDLTAHAGGAIFRQDWLDNLPTGGCLRFMDWMVTNERFDTAAPVEALADYPVEASQRWNRVPLSVLVSLCNTKSAHPWINIGHKWPDAMVTAWAEYLRDNLNSALRIRVELSNEIWNLGTFDQGDYFAAEAQTVWGVPDGYASNIYLHYAGKRFVEVMQIFNAVFAGQTHRLIGVIGCQAANTSVASALLNASSWQTYEPGSYVATRTLAKELSIAPYIGPSGDKTTMGNAIKAQLDISQADAVAYMKGLFPAAVQTSKDRIDDHVPLAAANNLRLTFYEFNNHFDLLAFDASDLYSGGNPIAGALEVFMEATYSQEMADAQDEVRDYFKAQNGSLMAFFTDMGRASKFGTWGAKTHLEHDSPIWTDLLAWHTANGRWWAQ